MLSSTLIRQRLLETLSEARIALSENNYPIGCVITDPDGNVITKTHNQYWTMQDITSHAEILALQNLKLSEKQIIVFSSLEPCFGCSFFLARTSATAIYSALKDPHKGGVGDLKKQEQFVSFFQNITVINEPFPDLRDESRELMRTYFLSQRKTKQAAFYANP